MWQQCQRVGQMPDHDRHFAKVQHIRPWKRRPDRLHYSLRARGIARSGGTQNWRIVIGQPGIGEGNHLQIALAAAHQRHGHDRRAGLRLCYCDQQRLKIFSPVRRIPGAKPVAALEWQGGPLLCHLLPQICHLRIVRGNTCDKARRLCRGGAGLCLFKRASKCHGSSGLDIGDGFRF